jgi:hypothetical protein
MLMGKSAALVGRIISMVGLIMAFSAELIFL